MYATEKKLNNTPFPDSLEHAEGIWLRTKSGCGGTFIYAKGIPTFGFRAEWNDYQGDGYAVGGYQDTVTVTLDGTDGRPEAAIARFLERIPFTGDGDKRYLLGTWIEGDTLYIDAVQIWAEEEDALNEARKNGEKAIFHFNTYETIYVEPVVEYPEFREDFEVKPVTVIPDGYVKLDDVIAFLQEKRVSFERIANDFRKLPDAENLVTRFEEYARCLEVHIIQSTTEKFSK